MLKRIIKGRDRGSKNYSGSNPQFLTASGSAAAIEYNRYGPPNGNFEQTSSSESPYMVDYNRSGPGHPTDMPVSDTPTAPGVDYHRTAPITVHHSRSFRGHRSHGSPPQPSELGFGSMGPPPVPQYPIGPPKSESRSTSITPAAYSSGPPPVAQRPQHRDHSFSPVQYQGESGSTISPMVVDYTRQQPPQQTPYEQAQGATSPPMVIYGQSPAGAYGSLNAQVNAPKPPVQQYPSYGNIGENASNQRPAHNQQGHPWVSPSLPNQKYNQPIHQNEYYNNNQPRQENAYMNTPDSGKSSNSSLYNPPYSSISNSTAPTSVYTPDRQNFNYPNTPTLPPQDTPVIGATDHDQNDPNVSKFVVRIFCQRKREEGDTIEESPRDIREFRLANLALIKLKAGDERYVLLDAVFGELDKAISPLLEKHWYLTQSTKVEDYTVSGGKKAVIIRNIMVAYQGTTSVLYADFKKDDDYWRFKDEIGFAMNTINSTANPVPKYYY